MTDRIIVGGIKFHAYHGLTRLEREVGVRCSIDVEMQLDLSPAIGSDRLGDTIDYREVHRLVLEIGQDRNSFHLIESLAGRIAEEILERFGVEETTVRVRKETPIIDGIVDYIGVQVTRRRSARSASPAAGRGRVRKKKRG
ncbi:MAG TPA: dihydroneopterin aldolase [Candidatus Polarisedimenticolia bacterium]|nr:dihydroneopterin aldolase [Candidatus Polarisedimenticolia bacterium]